LSQQKSSPTKHEVHENRVGTDTGTYTHRRKRIIDRLDNQRVAHPDEASSRERCKQSLFSHHQQTIRELRTNILRCGEFVRGSRKILQSRGDKTPFHERSPEKDGLGTCRIKISKGSLQSINGPLCENLARVAHQLDGS
jgi:hypothetical protein